MHRILIGIAWTAAALLAQPANSPKPEPLWPDGRPERWEARKPTSRRWLPTPCLQGRGVGTAVIVCPGGGYVNLSMDKEGDQIARWLNSLGVTAFVLKYRLGPKYHHPIELGDAQRAIRTVRAKAPSIACCRTASESWAFLRAATWPPPPARISTPATAERAGSDRRQSSRPDFLVLVVPGHLVHQLTCIRGPDALPARATTRIPSWWNCCPTNCR